ncbi:endonuclease/exonuclease/phosphatase family protein [Portibacter lacus]|uniref:Endonuclease/exonuclease/phosphatase domain-containing protein n=1 Tax=Portibacter lacus TaxID=1099794 RepID=A0AA37SM30_9BACT|nr:endonuclease/exonuclease/phosphatase family protein [Portibacter lacus]GLR15877.1 hypothetical protein GCM10007940_04920 [Portibacter lacus]
MHIFQRLSCLIVFVSLSISIFGQSLKIVSWNLKDFGQSRDDVEIELIAKEIRNADIVAIQEVVAKHPGGAQAVARLADQLNRTGAKWDYRISDPTQSSSPYKSERYAFLWKTSKVTITGGAPKLISSLSSIVEREPFLIQFKTKSKEVITLLNYHSCTHTKFYPERAEIKAISNWLLNQTFHNVIWCGDMNLVIDDIAFEKILSSGYTSVLSGQKTSLKMKCTEGNYLSRAEDNVLYNLSTLNYKGGKVLDFVSKGDCEDVTWKRTSYSDHLSIEIEVGI